MKTRHRLWQLTVVFIMATLAVVHSAEHPLPFTLKRQGEIVQDEPGKPQTRGDENADAFQYSIADGTVTITGYQGSATNLEIPATINGYPVIAIGYEAFSECDNLESVTIPEGVISIGDYAFYHCTKLTSVTIPEGVISIGDSAFRCCDSLASVMIPEGVISIGNSAFLSCDSLVSVTIPEGVISIGNETFCDCTNLASVAIPSTVTSIGDYAFSHCSKLTSVMISEGVTTIGKFAFLNCCNLTSVTIPEGVTTIGIYAFRSCTSLTSVTLPSTVTTIGGSAFEYCFNLMSVMIPKSVTSIDSNTFNFCRRLASIAVDEENDSYASVDGVLFDKAGTMIVRYPPAKPENTYFIPSGVTSIGANAFNDCDNLTGVTILEGMISIGDSAFESCDNLTSVTIPATVTSIGGSAFFSCTSLMSVTIPEGVTTISDCAFFHCYNLVSVTIPKGVISIGFSAFNSCTSLTSMTLPSTVTTISDYAFSSCTSLTSMMIPESVTTIGDYAFSSCTSLASVAIPSTVTSMGFCAFSSCTSLTSVAIPEGVTSIGISAFYYCTSLASVTIPSTVTSIDYDAFNECSGLAEMDFMGAPPSFGSDSYPTPIIFSVLPNRGWEEWDVSEGVTLTFREIALESIAIDGPESIENKAMVTYTCTATWSYGLDTLETPTWSLSSTAYASVDENGKVTNRNTAATAQTVTLNASYTYGGMTKTASLTITLAGMKYNTLEVVNGTGGGEYEPGTDVTATAGDAPTAGYVFDAWAAEGVELTESQLTANPLTFVMPTNDVTLTAIFRDAFQYSISDGTVTITGYQGSATNLEIPATRNGYPVVAIGSHAFEACDNLEFVTIPEGVTTIGEYAFSDCSNLTSVTIPEGVTTIGEYAFSDCSNLTSVAISSTVTTIGEYAFSYCSNLTSVTIPKSVTSIGNFAFNNCNCLASIAVDEENDSYASVDGVLFDKAGTMIVRHPPARQGTAYSIPSGVTAIADGAFQSCSGLTSVTIPNGVTSIGNYAFSRCSGLTSMTIPEGVTSIGNYAFSRCSGLTSMTIQEGVTSIGSYAFYYCSNLTSVTIPEGVTSIGSYAFRSCTSLTSVTIPEGVTSIGSYAFRSCTSLTSVTISSIVTSIGKYAFTECTALTEMDFMGAPPSFGSYSYPTPITFYVLPNRGWEEWTVPSGVTLTVREIALESIAIHGCTAIGKTSTATYVCTATWDYGPDTNETPTWSLSSTDYASVDENGKVTNRNTTATDQTVTLNASYTYGGVTKTASQIIVLDGTPQTSQTLELAVGWNWVGFNVLPENHKVGNVLGTAGFTVNDIIQTNGGSARFTGASWTPESFTIEYGKLYQIYVANDVEAIVNGVADGPSSLPLAAGWNWIANSTLEDLAPSQLTHGGGWAENDRIQAAGGNGVAYINGKWIPSGFMLESGKGYQIFTGNAGTLSFPATDDERYVVVDLSGGPVATYYPVRYSSVGPNLDDDTCRTTELWLRKIPAGTFIMGSPEDEVGRYSSNRLDMAQHEVTLTQDFYIGVFECTQKQWSLVMGDNPSEYKGDCRPVEKVSYNMIRGTGEQAGAGWPDYGHAVDSTSFMGKLQAKTGLTFDLPTEAQWEYACRAGTTTALNSGKNLTSLDQDTAMDEVGRYSFNTSDGKGGYSEHTTVGCYLPNAWGLYDMHGNVWEWCLDVHNYNYGTTPVVDPVGGALSGFYRVTRGGAWYDRHFNPFGAQYCRSASRWNPNPKIRYYENGFRVLFLP